MDFLSQLCIAIGTQIIEHPWVTIYSVVLVIGALIGIVYIPKSYRLTKAQAGKTPSLKITDNFGVNEEKLCFVLPFKDNRRFIVPFEIRIENIGDLSAHAVELFMEMNDSLYGRHVPRELNDIARARGAAFTAEESNNEVLTTTYLKIGHIPPQSAITAGADIGIAESSIYDLPVNAESHDGIEVNVIVRVDISCAIKLTVLYDNGAPVNKTMRVTFRNGKAKAVDEFVDEEREIASQLSGFKRPLSTSQRFIFFEHYDCVGSNPKSKQEHVYRARNDSVKIITMNCRSG